MIKSIELLIKNVFIILHKVALLRGKNVILCETNYKLSKRRKTKNKRFQKGGTLIIRKG